MGKTESKYFIVVKRSESIDPNQRDKAKDLYFSTVLRNFSQKDKICLHVQTGN